MCRLAGRHFESFYVRRPCRSTIAQCHRLAASACQNGHCWGKRRIGVYPANPDSCAGVTVYCSFMTVRYDISCGRLSPEFVPTRYSVPVAAVVAAIGEGFRTGADHAVELEPK